MCTMKNKALALISMLVIYIPIVVFLFTWCRLWVALIGMASIGYGFYRFIRDIDGEFKIDAKILCIFTAIFGLIFLFYGYFGNNLVDSWDWYKNNSVLMDLIDYDWPVYYENGGNNAMLTYYVGMYLVPALIGKIAGFDIAVISLCLLQTLIAVLVYLYLIKCLGIIKKWQYVASGLILLSFNFPYILCQIFLLIFKWLHIADASSIAVNHRAVYIYEGSMLDYAQHDSSLHMLCFRGTFRGFYMFLPYFLILLATFMWYSHRKKIDGYMFIWSPVLLYCTIALPYIFGVVAGFYIYYLLKEDKHEICRSIVDNLVCLGYVVPIIIYLLGNVMSNKAESVAFTFKPISWGVVIFVLVFLIFVFLMRPANKSDKLFHISFVVVLISLFASCGLYNDLMMDGLIPFIGFFIIFALRQLFIGLDKSKPSMLLRNIFLGIMIATSFVFCIGATSAVQKYVYDMPETAEHCFYEGGVRSHGSLSRYIVDDDRYPDDLRHNYFTYDYRDSIFHKYIARE